MLEFCSVKELSATSALNDAQLLLLYALISSESLLAREAFSSPPQAISCFSRLNNACVGLGAVRALHIVKEGLCFKKASQETLINLFGAP